MDEEHYWCEFCGEEAIDEINENFICGSDECLDKAEGRYDDTDGEGALYPRPDRYMEDHRLPSTQTARRKP